MENTHTTLYTPLLAALVTPIAGHSNLMAVAVVLWPVVDLVRYYITMWTKVQLARIAAKRSAT